MIALRDLKPDNHALVETRYHDSATVLGTNIPLGEAVARSESACFAPGDAERLRAQLDADKHRLSFEATVISSHDSVVKVTCPRWIAEAEAEPESPP